MAHHGSSSEYHKPAEGSNSSEYHTPGQGSSTEPSTSDSNVYSQSGRIVPTRGMNEESSTSGFEPRNYQFGPGSISGLSGADSMGRQQVSENSSAEARSSGSPYTGETQAYRSDGSVAMHREALTQHPRTVQPTAQQEITRRYGNPPQAPHQQEGNQDDGDEYDADESEAPSSGSDESYHSARG